MIGEFEASLKKYPLTAIFAPFQGRVLRFIVKPGDVLHSGSPLVVIEHRGPNGLGVLFLRVWYTLNQRGLRRSRRFDSLRARYSRVP
jgi:hypothetical protein